MFYSFILILLPIPFIVYLRKHSNNKSDSRIDPSQNIFVYIITFVTFCIYLYIISIASLLAYDLTCHSACHDGFADMTVGIIYSPIVIIGATLYASLVGLFLILKRNLLSKIVFFLFLVILFPATIFITKTLYYSSLYGFADISYLSIGHNDPNRILDESYLDKLKTVDVSSRIHMVHNDVPNRILATKGFVTDFNINSAELTFSSDEITDYTDPDFTGKKTTLYRISIDGSRLPIINFISKNKLLPNILITNHDQLVLAERGFDANGTIDFIVLDHASNFIGYHPTSSTTAYVRTGTLNSSDTNGFNPFYDSNVIIGERNIIFGDFRTHDSLFSYDFLTKKSKQIVKTKNPRACVIDKFAVDQNILIWKEVPDPSMNKSSSFSCFTYFTNIR